MESPYYFKIHTTTPELDEHWNSLAKTNVFLSKDYLKILEKAAPNNMCCYFISLYKQESLVGIGLAQFLDLNKLSSFGERDKCLKKSIRNILFRNFCSHVLFIGNNMLTGQNAFQFHSSLDAKKGVELLQKATVKIKKDLNKQGVKVHITTFKDFNETESSMFSTPVFQSFYRFSTQPNMIFKVNENWHSFDDYISALSKKYRDQYKRSRKKAEDIHKQKMNLSEILTHEETIYTLYYHVAQNAPFNTFFLPRNHFSELKKNLKEMFLFYGYFENNKLIGFNTLIKNGTQMDTYFLGYDETIQREKMLYLNMLYDMIAYSINKGFKEIIFARTALEIKSSVGAEPEEMFGFIHHSNSIINSRMKQLFCYLEPKIQWQKRNPFK